MGITTFETLSDEGLLTYHVFHTMPAQVGLIAVTFKLVPDHPLDETLDELMRLRDKAIRKKTKNKYQKMIDQVWPIINKDRYPEED